VQQEVRDAPEEVRAGKVERAHIGRIRHQALPVEYGLAVTARRDELLIAFISRTLSVIDRLVGRQKSPAAERFLVRRRVVPVIAGPMYRGDSCRYREPPELPFGVQPSDGTAFDVAVEVESSALTEGIA